MDPRKSEIRKSACGRLSASFSRLGQQASEYIVSLSSVAGLWTRCPSTAGPGTTVRSGLGCVVSRGAGLVQVALIFGARTLDYVSNLCKGKFDFLERLSDSLLLSIISYLDLEDVARLSQTSRRFSKLCQSDMLWEQIVQSACDTITPDMRALAEDMGWRQMFFTSKLQLQRWLRKRRQRQGSQQQTLL